MASGIRGVFPWSPASQGLISRFSALLFLETLFLTCMYEQVPEVLVAVCSCAAPGVCGGRQVT